MPMPRTPLGSRITASTATAASRTVSSAARWRRLSAGRGRGIGNGAQRDGRSGAPNAHALALFHQPDEPPMPGVPQRLDDLEHDRVPQRRVRHLEAALDHHPLRQLPGGQLGVHSQMLHADVGDLALLEEPVAHDVARPPAFGRREQLNRRVHMRKVVLRMRDLRLVRLDLLENLGAFLRQCLDDQGLGHAAIAANFASSVHPANWCICYLRPEDSGYNGPPEEAGADKESKFSDQQCSAPVEEPCKLPSHKKS